MTTSTAPTFHGSSLEEWEAWCAERFEASFADPPVVVVPRLADLSGDVVRRMPDLGVERAVEAPKAVGVRVDSLVNPVTRTEVRLVLPDEEDD